MIRNYHDCPKNVKDSMLQKRALCQSRAIIKHIMYEAKRDIEMKLMDLVVLWWWSSVQPRQHSLVRIGPSAECLCRPQAWLW